MESQKSTEELSDKRLEWLFEEIAVKQPDLCAIHSFEQSLSYAELNQYSNGIAHCLLDSTALKNRNLDGPIVTLIESNIDQIAAQIGILKANQHFVCLDSCHPSERLIGILAESPPDAIILDSAILRHPTIINYLREQSFNIITINLSDTDLSQLKNVIKLDKISCSSEQNPPTNKDPSAVAYIAYTSGSTGLPKGIVQSHRSFSQFISWQARQFDIGPNKRIIQWASIGYDASLCEIFGALCFGATLCVATPEVRFNPLSLSRWVTRVEADLLQIVPSFCRQIIEVMREAQSSSSSNVNDVLMPNLKLLLLAGEALPSDLALAWRSLQKARIYNLYGPSESVLATYHEFVQQDSDSVYVPIGQPIDGRSILILDCNQSLSKAGDKGELYIQSQYLTLGYLKREKETKQQFIQNPLHNDFSDPVFRTGDIVRLKSDNLLEFIGRQDNLVKLRGMRVELGEIESVIRQQPLVKDCAVKVCRLDRQQDRLTAKDRNARQTVAAGSQLLVAYITTSGTIKPSELRSQIRTELPVHMLPQQIIWLDEMPINANRKLDYNALPNPEKVRPEIDNPFKAASNPIQQQLVAIWSDILGFDGIGVDDPFLDLGGDSLLAMQAINRVEKQFKIKLPATLLMQNSSIEQLELALVKHREATACKPEKSSHSLKSELSAGVNKPAVIPLTHSQWGLWYLWKLDPSNPFYTAQGSIHLEGELRNKEFFLAWKETVARHEVLRTQFVMNNGEPAQTFNNIQAENITFSDLSHLDFEDARNEMDKINTKLGKHAFHLENDSLLQLQLFKLADGYHEFVFTYQEIIFDLWGFAIIINDLMQAYSRIILGENAYEQSLEIQFSDFAIWEKQNIKPQNLAAEDAFWKKRLHGKLPVLDLPIDYPRTAEPDYAGSGESCMLDQELSSQLKQISRENGVTLYTTILSAFYIFLRQYTGQKDIIIGTPLANRATSGAESLVGWFLNMLPIRIDAGHSINFLELLEQSKKISNQSIDNADYPFRWMLEWADIPRDRTISPVFQVMFNWQNLPQLAPKVDGLQVSSSEVDSTFKKYDLALYAQEHLDRIYLQFSYLTKLFKPSKIQRMLSNFSLTLKAVCENPKQDIMQLAQISPEEKKWLLQDINQTEREYDRSQNIASLFETQAASNPTGIAIIFDGKEVTYDLLNQSANQIARWLKNNGVVANDRVSLCINRSVDMIATLLAVAKLGAIHIALDSNFPQTRLQEICRHVNCKAFIHQDSTYIDSNGASILLNLDSEKEQLKMLGGENLKHPGQGSLIFNIVYTSGSTGKPKGLSIPTRAVVNRLNWMWQEFPFQPGDAAVLQKSYSIVASNWEIFGALLKGIPTVLLQHDEVIDGAKFWQSCCDNNVSYLLGSPGLLSNILNQAEQPAHTANSQSNLGWDSLRLATTSAEPISPELVLRWRKRFPNVPLLNLYGATECSSNATCFDTKQLSSNTSVVPIGRPIDNNKVYLLNESLEMIPQGVVGEMCVSGDSLASDYFAEPELTASRFIANPFSSKNHEKLCKTGDLAKINEEGMLELVGRKDLQVKVRGFRVELGELESAANSHANVIRSAASVYQDASGATSLSLYLESKDEWLEKDQLRHFLSQQLPSYMLPTKIMRLDKLPKTPSGKLDRLALPEIDSELDRYDIVAAKTSAEKVVVSVWSKVLKLEKVGINNDFFDLGGHSLMATEMVSQLLDIFQVELSIRSIFDAPTISKLIEGPLSEALGDLQLVEEVADIWMSIDSPEREDG